MGMFMSGRLYTHVGFREHWNTPHIHTHPHPPPPPTHPQKYIKKCKYQKTLKTQHQKENPPLPPSKNYKEDQVKGVQTLHSNTSDTLHPTPQKVCYKEWANPSQVVFAPLAMATASLASLHC